ncbi:MAG: hypothetical protein M1827_004668 [Pycnora praestabilis]|nr:MAG: hypothetical protein M1827_004668 [Pycnora praestabilis]
MPSLVTNGANGNTAHFAEYPSTDPQGGMYRVLDQYHSQRSRIRVACVGAGASGICLAYKMEKMLRPGTWDLVLFDKNSHFGGTWLENTYPGVACDIPAHLYTYTFDPNPNWTQFFAQGPEIQTYFERFVDQHNTRQYMKLDTKVIEGKWVEEKGIWTITLQDQQTGEEWEDWAHVFINGTGILNSWKWPEVEGLHDFKGPLMHSAKWDHSVNFADKTVGVIGTGSTSVQIVPQLQQLCKKVDVFMRSPTWISPPFGAGALETDFTKGSDVSPGQRQYDFTEADKQRFRDDPEYHLDFRKRIEAEINGLFGMYQENSEMSEQFRAVITKEMNRRMGPGNEKLKAFIIPKWAPGCRRISPGDGYLEALVQPNVEPVLSDITKVIPEGVITADGKEHKLDILVCATGFAVAFKPAFRVVNGAGETIQQDWRNGVNLYMGVSAPRFPNYYTIVGPGATWSNGTLLPSIETTIEYAIKMMEKIQSEHIRAIEVKQEAVDELFAHLDEFHKTTVWKQECRSCVAHIVLQTIHFLKSIKDPRYEDYNIRYRTLNRFAYLGNGEVKATKGRDAQGLATYFRSWDHDWSVD